MAKIPKATFLTLYANALGLFLDNSTREISEADMRAVMQDIADSLYPDIQEVTIEISDMLTLGTVPIALIVAPEASQILSVYRVVVSKESGAADYAFTGDIIFYTDGGDILFTLPAGEFNPTGAAKHWDLIKQGQRIVSGEAFKVGTSDDADSATGDSDVFVKIYYTIEDVLT